MKLRSTFFSLTAILVMLVSLMFPTTPAYAAAGINEDFRNSTAPNWTLLGSAVLTSGNVDPVGDGWLRLTSNTLNQAGSAIYDTAFSNTAGIQVSFLYATYGGTGADGITFYLIDGATASPTVGGTGGALGYSWRDKTIPGVTNGYVGIGFDELGNFTNSFNDNYGTGGYADGVNPDRIAIRGPGNLLDAGGFPYLTSVPMPIETGSRANAKHVVITITPSPTQTISVTVDGVAQITNYDISGYAMPATFKMGFSAGTGSLTNYHEIRNLTVTGLTPSNTVVVTSGSPSVVGTSVTFTATVSGATTPTGNVAFYDDTTYLGTGVLDGTGVATYTTSALTLGNHTIIANYLGDSDYAVSQGTVAQSVIVVPAPTIGGLTPNSGPTAGGTTVVITGTNLTGGTVTFGGLAATCTVNSATQITCTTPPHAAGPVDVVVTTPGGPVTSVGGFTYIPPVFSLSASGAATVKPGDEYVYTFTYTTTAPAINAQIVFSLPGHTTYVSNDGGFTCTPVSGVVTCTLGAIAANGAFNVTVQVDRLKRVDTPLTLEAAAYVMSDNGTAVINGAPTVTANIITPFADVPAGHWALDFVQSVWAYGITGGCVASPLAYCPNSNTTRADMAVYIERAKNGSSYDPGVLPLTFTDTTTHYARYFIEVLKNDGITGGCGGALYCPNTAITRGQAAVFLLRGLYGSSYYPPAATGAVWLDVPATHWSARWAEELKNANISAGCGGGKFCPDGVISRAEMAVFVQRTFNLPMPTP